MERDNICKFVPLAENAPTDIHPVNFVWETSQIAEKPMIRSVYAIHIVLRGSGVLVCDEKSQAIKKGDVFIIKPHNLYSIRSTDELEYAYVSFLGLGAPALLNRISPQEIMPVFEQNDELVDFWMKAIETANPKNIDLISKSVLEYSAAALIAYSPQANATKLIENIEQYVRIHFTDSELSLKSLAKQFGYNEKYLSKIFYRFSGTHFGDYLMNLRINAACGLMQDGQTVVKQIAYACGFSDALYFSKVFKRKMKCSPTEFISKKNQPRQKE